ncbi:DNA-binding PadR family transcriptional regulator [Microbacterium sp. AK009]|uniref:PadR family transcriptional regulator n=1 Tax=Microbacterium sp. AK009 TaxID=2723068 RepID=UPI0015CB9C6F|nr:PadR family transcriptional regulator [Microbacterium sp. AK009]NYF15886.1 DNA-binding PadR family transcriptional regulator [Microbacterium sp. AK009]
MSVPQSLLAILDQGACYGYQLRAEHERRTGAEQPLNVGQIYRTLERLERDGLVARGEPDAQGHIYWSITPAGSAAVAEWFASPAPRARTGKEDVAAKVVLAASLPGVDVDDVLAGQRRSSESELTRVRDELGAAERVGALPRTLVLAARREALEAEVRWLDHAAAVIARHPDHALAMALAIQRPRRGRPPRP